jgi:aminoglycoside phosphotransferase (APT) family kinase protein
MSPRFHGVNVQRLLSVDHRKRLLFFEWLRGEPLSELILRGRASDSELRATGAALARLHKGSAPALQIRDPNSEGLKLVELGETLRRLTPLWHDAARRAAERVADIVACDPCSKVVTHGDFYSQQVLLDAGAVFIIDLDEVAIGTPGMDLGNFVAHLEFDVLLGQLRPEEAERVRGVLSDGYSKIAELPSEQLLAAYTAAGLLRLSHDPFRRHLANWPAITGQIIGRVQSMLAPLATYESSTGKTGDADLRRRINHEADPAMPWLDDALDPLCAARELSGRLRLNERPLRVSSVQAVRLVRHKRGRRALLEYLLDLDEDSAVPRSYVAKVRARRLDRATYELLRALRASGFGDDAADGIRIPSPAGLVKRFNMWLSEKVSGTPATEFLLGAAPHDVMCHVFNAAEKLHHASVLPVREHTMGDELSTLSDRMCQLGARRPDLQRRIEDLFRGCEQIALGYLEHERTPVHRDYYGDQLLIEGRDVWLLDLDQFSMGDPALDYGNFLGHVTELALRQTGATDAAITANTALLDSCRVAHGAEFAERVEVYHTLTLVRHLWISTEKEERRDVTDPLLRLCENRLEAAASETGIRR